jgi:hypothetical protein
MSEVQQVAKKIVVRRCKWCDNLTLDTNNFCQGSGHQFRHSKCDLNVVFANRKYVEDRLEAQQEISDFISDSSFDDEFETEFKISEIASKAREMHCFADKRYVCVVCLEGDRNHVAIPCGHVILCDNCSEHQALRNCPICRVRIKSIHKIFL